METNDNEKSELVAEKPKLTVVKHTPDICILIEILPSYNIQGKQSIKICITP